MSCPGHNVMVWTGPGEDDYDPDIDYCGYDCLTERTDR